MKNIKKKQYRGDGAGFVWPNNGTTTPDTIGDVFGARPFAPHVPTVGYDYDLHRGIDLPGGIGDPLYSPINGNVIRLHRTHFWWTTDDQLNFFSETDPNSSFSYSRDSANNLLVVTGSRAGAQTFPADVGFIEPIQERVVPTGDDWVVELNFTSSIGSKNGYLGFGIYDKFNNEYASLEYNGSDFIIRGKDTNGVLAADGATASAANQLWFRVEYTNSTGQIAWRYGTDGSSWTNITQSIPTFTSASVPIFSPILYWRSVDSNLSKEYIPVDRFTWQDDQTIQRFGNWIEISNESEKTVMVHFNDLNVDLGDTVTAGQLVGIIGITGYDQRSGRILYPHVHLEYITNNGYDYSNDDPINPLNRLPYSQSNANISASRSTENDPDGTTSWKLDVVVSRSNQEFDLNQVSLTGDSATRTVNWDTRAGLNADVDIPIHDGVYIVPQNFTSQSLTYNCSFYFNKSTVGTTFVSAEIRDVHGNIVWSE